MMWRKVPVIELDYGQQVRRNGVEVSVRSWRWRPHRDEFVLEYVPERDHAPADISAEAWTWLLSADTEVSVLVSA